MRRPSPGYTLVELVVVLVVGLLLAGYGARSYLAASENAKADAAKSLLVQIAQSNRMYAMDRGSYLTGAIGARNRLVADRLIADRVWGAEPYAYGGADDSLRPCVVATARRRGTRLPPYRNWGFCADVRGAVYPMSAGGRCPAACP